MTGFFGDSIRFRIEPEHRRRDAAAQGARRAARSGKVAVFFVDDNFAINVKRTKSLLRDIIAAGAATVLGGADQRQPAARRGTARPDRGFGRQVDLHRHGVARSGQSGQRQQELQQAGGICRRAAGAGAAQRLRHHVVHLRTGSRYRRAWPSARWPQIREWPPVLPVFGQITPFPATPLYDRLEKEGRLTRPKHWLEFAPFQMAHTPLKMTIPEVQDEVRYAWTNSYSPAATARALESIADEPAPYKISHLMARIFFRGIYFPPKGPVGLAEGDREQPRLDLACPPRIVYTMARHAERRPPAACRRARVIRSFGIGIRLRQAVPR